MQQETLVYLPMDKWQDLADAFESIGDEGATGVLVLKFMKMLVEKGLDFGFKVYCPNGDVWSGMVGLSFRDNMYEVVALCPKSDTTDLEKALEVTTLIDWNHPSIGFPHVPKHVHEMLVRVAEKKQVPIVRHYCESYILRRTTVIDGLSLPPDVTFGKLSLDHAELVDSVWPHRFPGSVSVFQLIIKTGFGFGLFIEKRPVAWLFVRELGSLLHLYTIEEFRRKGYAELLLKLVSNEQIKQNNHAVGFCVYGNYRSCNLFRKVGFERFGDVAWTFVNLRQNNP